MSPWIYQYKKCDISIKKVSQSISIQIQDSSGNKHEITISPPTHKDRSVAIANAWVDSRDLGNTGSIQSYSIEDFFSDDGSTDTQSS